MLCSKLVRGMYDAPIQAYMDTFPRAHFCIVSSDFYVAEPEAALTLVCDVCAVLLLSVHRLVRSWGWMHHSTRGQRP
jgi:hypothetical protein